MLRIETRPLNGPDHQWSLPMDLQRRSMPLRMRCHVSSGSPQLCLDPIQIARTEYSINTPCLYSVVAKEKTVAGRCLSSPLTPITSIAGNPTRSRLNREIVEIAAMAALQMAVNTHIQVIRIVSTSPRVMPINLIAVLRTAFTSPALRNCRRKARTNGVVWACYAIVSCSTAYSTSHDLTPSLTE